MKSRGLIVVMVVVVIFFNVLIIGYKHNNTNSNTSNEEEKKLTREQIELVVKDAMVEYKDEIDSLDGDAQRISKFLMTRVNKKCNNQAELDDIIAVIDVVLAE